VRHAPTDAFALFLILLVLMQLALGCSLADGWIVFRSDDPSRYWWMMGVQGAFVAAVVFWALTHGYIG
jgi:hypothetical protein